MKLIKTLLVLILAATFFSCGSGKEKKSAEKKSTEAEVWTFLFDGTTTQGWRGYNKTAFPEQGWEIVDGTLHCIGSGKGEAGGQGGDILYDKKFSNFHLKLEWKISEGGNSGIIYLVQESPEWSAPWKTGPEMQVPG